MCIRDRVGKTLIDLDFRKKYGVNIIAIKGPENAINVSPLPGDVIADGDVLVVIGEEESISRLEQRGEKQR